MATPSILFVLLLACISTITGQDASSEMTSTMRPRISTNVMNMASSTTMSSTPTMMPNMTTDGDDSSDSNMNIMSQMGAMNATAAVYDEMSDVVQAAMNATAYLFSNTALQSFMSAQDGMDWMWRPSVSARWCRDACIGVNKTMCPSGQLDRPMMRTDSCRTCVLECLACTFEDNYYMTMRSYVMSLMAPLIQLASSTMAVDMSDLGQATQAQQAQQNMYDKFNAAVSPLSNRMMLDRMFGLNCQMFAGYQAPTADASVSASNAGDSADAMANGNNNKTQNAK